MKFLLAASLASLSLAAPAEQLDKRQGCSVAFVWARGSAEPAPLGPIIGQRLETALKKKLPGMKTFPVMYAASLLTNISPARTDQASIDEGKKAFEKANSECPSAKIIAGGYSQGAAVMHNTIGLTKSLSEAIKSKIVGVALFGDTRNQQDKGHIPNFPNERSKVWCNKDDGVCGGQLVVNAGHMSYDQKYIEEAAEWLAQRVNGGGASSGGDAEAAAPAPAAPAKGMGKGAKGGAGAGAMAGDHGHGR